MLIYIYKYKSYNMKFINKIGEYILYVGTSAFIIYFVFRNVFGTPFQQKDNYENVKQLVHQVDTIKAMEQFNMDGIYSLRDSVSQIMTSIDRLSIAVENNTREMSNMKKIVNQKINTANRIITLNQPTQPNTGITNTTKNQVLDSFFRAKYNNVNKNK